MGLGDLGLGFLDLFPCLFDDLGYLLVSGKDLTYVDLLLLWVHPVEILESWFLFQEGCGCCFETQSSIITVVHGVLDVKLHNSFDLLQTCFPLLALLLLPDKLRIEKEIVQISKSIHLFLRQIL